MEECYSREKTLNFGLASVKMEGFPVTAQTRRDCERLMNGEITVAELAAEIVARTVGKKQ